MIDITIKGDIDLSVLLSNISKLYNIAETDIMDLYSTDKNTKCLLYYSYVTYKEGDFRTMITIYRTKWPQTISDIDFNVWVTAWHLSNMLNKEIVVSPTNDIQYPYLWFLIKDGIFYLAEELLPPDYEDEKKEYGFIFNYSTLEPTFFRLPKEVRQHLKINSTNDENN